MSTSQTSFQYETILDDDLSENKWPKALMKQKENAAAGEHISLMAQTMTPDLFEKLRNRTTLSGWTIARAINTGTRYASSSTGCHAGDLESYHTFKELFYPIIESYHKEFKINRDRHPNPDLDASNISMNFTPTAKQKIVSTRVRIARNLAMFPFNPAGTKESRLGIESVMKAVFDTLEGDLAGDYFSISAMTKEETQKLIDDHYLFKGKDKFQAASGYHEHWPHGRGIFMAKSKELLVWVNEGDHLRIISMDKSSDIKKCFGRLGQGVLAIEEAVQKLKADHEVFAHDEVLGMITCCPTNLGSGMRCSAHVLLPKLCAKIGLEGINEIAFGLYCQARGSKGEHSDAADCKIDISNLRRLGFKETHLIEDTIACINHLAKLEDDL